MFDLEKAVEAHALWLKTRFSGSSEGGRLSVPINANLRNANLSDANLRNANLRNANLRNANLRNADLSGADLRNANLRNADLRNTDLRNTDLRNADLWSADLRNANLDGVNLSGADLRNANLSGANLWGTIGNSRELISIQTKKYSVCYTFDRLQIGCKNYPIADWWAFDDATIAEMDHGALEWWEIHKPILQALIAANPTTQSEAPSE